MLGPALVAVKVKVTLLPTLGVALLAVLVIPTLDCATGVGVTLEVLFPGVGSASLAAILALLVYVPEALTVAMIDKVALAPLAKAPIAQIPVPLV
ncbi:hypothetical protein FLA105534_00002 [Flavobacterium bizetiae]|uniref:Uncharacterized protein n=1 Tax=Flavobacterium bizetiae TaxID=2704140 RepID=A0A6J4G832_9FLAO|nr:hypothetical protein FLA105534_00002 [Flavobacterium bizetiae]